MIGDGAPWIWNIADEQFHGATQIADLFHVRGHYWNVAKACFGKNKEILYQWTEERRKELDDGRPEEVIDAIHRASGKILQHFTRLNFIIVKFYRHVEY